MYKFHKRNQMKFYFIILVPTLFVIVYIVIVAWHISGACRGRTKDKEPGFEEKSAIHSED